MGSSSTSSYLDVVLQLLPPLLRRFGPQVGVPFAGEIWCLDDLPELKVIKEVKSTVNRQQIYSQSHQVRLCVVQQQQQQQQHKVQVKSLFTTSHSSCSKTAPPCGVMHIYGFVEVAQRLLDIHSDCKNDGIVYVLCTYFSVESVKFAVSSQHKMFPLVKQNFNSEKLQTGKTKITVII